MQNVDKRTQATRLEYFEKIVSDLADCDRDQDLHVFDDDGGSDSTESSHSTSLSDSPPAVDHDDADEDPDVIDEDVEEGGNGARSVSF